MDYERTVQLRKHRNIRVTAVTRYVITDFAKEYDPVGGGAGSSASRPLGEFDNPVQANEAGRALAHYLGASFEPVHDPKWELPREKWKQDSPLFRPETGSPGREAAESEAAKAEALRQAELQPGTIRVAGDVTLASWRNSADTTKIEGGSIAGNTVTASNLFSPRRRDGGLPPEPEPTA